MANRSYLPTSHRLLTGYPSPLTSPRGSVVSSSRSSPPPEFSYDVFPPRDPNHSSRNSAPSREGIGSYNRAPTSPGNSGLGMAYSSVQDFPYGLSGVQMPTYNFGSELYNYVSNGFPRKSRMCTFCNKVFTRSTTRRYHERRCPLLRASNSLAKNEENNTSSLTAMKEQQSQQQRQKESPGGGNGGGGGSNGNRNGGHHNSTPSSALPRTLSSSITNTTTAQSGLSVPLASPPLPSLHPAYPTSFPKPAAMVTSPSRTSGSYSYPHPYSSHFYNSLSAAALASLDQNSNKQQQHQQQQQRQQQSDSDSISWKTPSSPPTPNSKIHDHVSSFNSKLSSTLTGGHLSALPKAFTPEAVVDLTARYCADFSLRTRPPVFPAPSLRAPPHSPPSPEPGETKGHRYEDEIRDGQGRQSPDEAMAAMTAHHRNKLWLGGSQEKLSSRDHADITSSSLARDAYRRQDSSPSSETWHEKDSVESRTFMKVEPLDEDEEEEFEDEEDEDEMEEDEEQFKTDTNNLEDSEAADEEVLNLNSSGSPYNELVCRFCEKLFSDTVARKAHETLHSQKKIYACCLCSDSFHCAYSLRVHTTRNHKDGPYKCKYCFLDYGHPSDVRTHLVKEHSLPKTEYQSLDYFSFITDSASPSSTSMLNNDNAVSEGEGEHDQYSPGDAFKLQRRSADHAENKYNFSYSHDTTKALLSPHSVVSDVSVIPATNGMAKSASEPEEDMEVCKICNKSFTKSSIRLHERSHADQKPYECPICNKRFGYKNNMKSHMKLHQGLKPYQCQICGARFTRGSTLRRHGRRHNISNSAMLEYALYDQRVGGRSGAASLAHKASLVPNSILGAKSQYVLPNNSNKNNSNNNHNNHNSNAPPLPHQSQPSPAQSTDLHSAIMTSKHSMFGSMPSLIHAASTASSVSNSLDAERFNGHAKQRSPTRHSPPGNSPRVTNSHFPSHTSITNPMVGVGGLAAVAAANLFAYPNAAAAAAAPHLFQFYASAANPLMNYPYPATPNTHTVQSDALNLSLHKRKSTSESEATTADDDDYVEDDDDDKKWPTKAKLSKIENKITTSQSNSKHDQFADSSNAGSDSLDTIKQELNIKQEIEPNEIRSETKNGVDKKDDVPSPQRMSPTSNSRLESETENDTKDEDNDKNFKNHSTHPHHCNHSPHHSDNSDDHQLGLKVSTEDFGAQVNICCPSPQVQSSTGSLHSNSPNNSPVGSSSGPDSHAHIRASPSGMSHASSSSPVNSNSAPSPTNPDDSGGQDILLSLIGSGRLFRCSFCDIYFTEYAMFRLHKKYHESDSTRPFLCAVCREDCKDKTYFTVHLSEHLGLGPKAGLL